MKIIIPMAGRGSRFAGKKIPKPFLPVADKPMIAWTLMSIKKAFPDLDPSDLIFIVLEEHEHNFGITKKIKHLAGDSTHIITIPDVTEGPVCTVLVAMHLLEPYEDFFTVDCDQYFLAPDLTEKISNARAEKLAGLIPVWQSNNPAYSYIRTNQNGIVIETAEKKVISNNAAIGIYYFGSRTVYEKAAQEMISKRIMTKNEFYMCPLYNMVIKNGGKVRITNVSDWMTMGTPPELALFEKKINS